MQQGLINQAAHPIDIPEKVPRLYDLIRVKDERVKPAFYFTLRNTLVADNLEQATRIGYGRMRFRIVTLKGELIEPSGTMSGGGNRCSRGRMGRNVTTDTSGTELSAKDIAQMEQRLQQLTERLAELRQTKATLEEEVARLTRDIRDSSANLTKWKMEVQAMETQQQTLKEQIKVQEKKVAECASDKKRVKSMEAAVEQKRKAYQEAVDSSAEIEAKVKKIHDKIVELTEGKMNSAREKLDAVTKQMDKIRAEKTKLTVAINTSERNVKKCLEKIATLEQEVQEDENELRKLQERRKQIEEEAMTFKSNTEGLETAEKELKEKLGKFKAELDAALK